MIHQGTVQTGEWARKLSIGILAAALLATVTGCADELVIPTRLDVPEDARTPTGDQPGIFSSGERATPPKTQEEVDEDIRDLEALRETIRRP